MNIFAVHEDPQIAGASLPDKLVVKMTTESLQLLAPWAFNTFEVKIEKPGLNRQLALLESEKLFYGTKGFAYHPCSKWLYETPANVHWVVEHAFGMAQEYWERYNKYHGALFGLDEVRTLLYKNFNAASSRDHSPFVQAMPDQYKDPANPVQAYRNYLMGEKGYAVWKHGNQPEWWSHEKHKPARDRYLAEKERKRLERLNAKHNSVSRSLQT
jgi:hypothetical protein